MKLILVRHGETDWNRERRIQGHTDIPLNDRGKAQADAIASRLKNAGICAVYSSPLQRALYTGEAIARGNGCPVYTRDGLMEIVFGSWEGRTGPDVAAEFPERWSNWGANPELSLAEGAESLMEVMNRSVAVVEELIKSHSDTDTVCITTHSMPIKTIIAHYIGIPTEAFVRLTLDNCGYTALSIRSDGSARLTALNDTSHLISEGLI